VAVDRALADLADQGGRGVPATAVSAPLRTAGLVRLRCVYPIEADTLACDLDGVAVDDTQAMPETVWPIAGEARAISAAVRMEAWLSYFSFGNLWNKASAASCIYAFGLITQKLDKKLPTPPVSKGSVPNKARISLLFVEDA